MQILRVFRERVLHILPSFSDRCPIFSIFEKPIQSSILAGNILLKNIFNRDPDPEDSSKAYRQMSRWHDIS